MLDPNYALLAGAFILLAAILLGAASSRVGLPVLLVFLVVGMLAGEDGPGGIVFNDVPFAFLVGNLALAIILLDGGLRTRYETFRVGLAPAVVLATAGVALTAAAVGAFAAWLLAIDLRLGLMLGAVVGSTDAAAVFAILKGSGTRLNDRLAATLEIESGVNDPMAVFLTVMLIGVLLGPGTPTFGDFARSFALQVGGGLVGGLVFGALLAWLVARASLPEGLYALLFASGGVLAFALTNTAGGSGFLAVYLVGVLVGNRRVHADENVLRAMDGLAWLAQASMFLLLGLLVTPLELLPIVGPGLLIAAFLMLVARPVAVAICLAPFRVAARETVFVSWVGLRGAVPVVLALFPLMADVEGARMVFNIAFCVVLVSLLVQGSTVAMAARHLGVDIPPHPEPVSRAVVDATREGAWEVMQFKVGAASPAVGQRLDELTLPPRSRPVAVFRGGAKLEPSPDLALRAFDRLTLLARSEDADRVATLLADVSASGPLAPRAFFGDFVVGAEVKVADLTDLYGLQVDPAWRDRTLDQLLSEKLRRRAVIGDQARLGKLVLTVRDVDHGRVTRVGLKLPYPR